LQASHILRMTDWISIESAEGATNLSEGKQDHEPNGASSPSIRSLMMDGEPVDLPEPLSSRLMRYSSV
jgi:hypothetical protein